MTIYVALVPFINYNDIRSPLRNITGVDMFITYFLLLILTLFLTPIAIIFYIGFRRRSDSQDDGQPNDDDGVSFDDLTIWDFAFVLVCVVVVSVSLSLVTSNYEEYDEYEGGYLSCHIPNPTYQNDIREDEVVDFSDLNEVDRGIFRMTVNNSYLTSVRDDLDEGTEYSLLVAEDRGNDEIILYEGDVDVSTHMPPPDGMLTEPRMGINESEYFSGGMREKPHIRYQGDVYWCLVHGFYIQGA